MRFKIGSIVEVWTKKKVPSGAWRCAEIVSDNGLSYTVRFYRGRGIPKEGADEVKAGDIRPSAPLLGGCVAWDVGEVVEVLDDGYWKVSMIEEVMEEDNYQIRVIGSIDEFRVNKSSIRTRQELKENKWMLMDKDCGYCEDMISRMRKNTLVKQQQCGHNWQLVPDSAFLSKMLKRKSPDSPFDIEENLKRVHRQRAVNKEVDISTMPNDSYSFVGKVDITTRSRENNSKNHLQYLTKTTSTIIKSHKNLGKATSITGATELADSALWRHLSLSPCVDPALVMGCCNRLYTRIMIQECGFGYIGLSILTTVTVALSLRKRKFTDGGCMQYAGTR